MGGYFFIVLFVTSFHLSSVYSLSCTTLPDHNLTVLVDWPFNLTCNHDLILNNNNSSECLINNGSHSSIIINLDKEDVSKGIYYNMTLRSLNGTCKSWRVWVQVESGPTLTLPTKNEEEAVTEAVQADALYHQNITSEKFNYNETILLQSIRLRCIKENSEFYYPVGSYEINWYQTEFLRNGNAKATYNVQKYADRFHYLDNRRIIQINPTFYEAGLYTCVVKQGNKAVITSHTQLCIKQQTHELHPLLQCNDEITFDNLDNRKNISCIGQIDSNIIDEKGIKVTWFRRTSGGIEEIICENTKLNEVKEFEQANCKINDLPNRERFCFEYSPEGHEVENPQESLPVSLLLKNLRRSDAGQIYVRLEHLNRTSEVRTIQLNFNNLNDMYMAVGIVGGVIFLLFICGFVAHKYRHPILLKFRRHFGKYDKDDKEYVAILSYFFDGEFDQEARDTVDRMISWTKHLFEKKNYSYYDAQEHMELGPWAETFIRNLDKSHRMIVFMTEEYVKEAKKRFETKQALENMRKNKTKIIVVKTKGAEKALKESGNIKFKRDLKATIRGMRNVVYKHGMSEAAFSDMMDYALPNLDRSDKHDNSEEDNYEMHKEGSLNPSFTSNGATVDSTAL